MSSNVYLLKCSHEFPIQSLRNLNEDNPKCPNCSVSISSEVKQIKSFFLTPNKKEQMRKNFEIYQDSKCPICLELYTDPKKLPCSHVFCSSCLLGFWESNPRCALCMKEFFIEINSLQIDEFSKKRVDEIRNEFNSDLNTLVFSPFLDNQSSNRIEGYISHMPDQFFEKYDRDPLEISNSDSIEMSSFNHHYVQDISEIDHHDVQDISEIDHHDVQDNSEIDPNKINFYKTVSFVILAKIIHFVKSI